MTKAASVTFVASFLLLNVFFAWDSGLLRTISPSLNSIVAALIHWQYMALYNYFNLARISGYAYIVVDIESLALLIASMISFAWLSRGRGVWTALLRSTQVAALSLVIFGVELWVLDCSEFFIHVTDFQEVFHFFPAFTNADMLFSSLAVLVGSTLLINRSRLEANWARLATANKSSSPPSNPVVVNRRNLGRFLILFLFGILFLVGGWLLAYYGGVWLLSYSTTSSLGENSVAITSHHVLTTYSGCLSHLKIVSGLAGNSTCNFNSYNSDELAFVGLGGVSILAGLFALRKHPTVMAESTGRFWWLLALVVPLLGGVIGYIVARNVNVASGTNMMVLGIQTLPMLLLLLSSADLMGLNSIFACQQAAFLY